MSKIDLIIDALECASPTIKGVMYPAGYHMKLAQALAAARELKALYPEPHTTLYDVCQEVLRLEKVNAELLEALKEVVAYCEEHGHSWSVMAQAKATIAKAGE